MLIGATYNYWNIAAILCHECAHYAMNRLNLHAPAGCDEEIFTDIFTIVQGFGYIMKQGYKQKQKTQTMYNVQQTKTHKIGYLTSQEILYLDQHLSRLVEEEHKRREAEKAWDQEVKAQKEAQKARDQANKEVLYREQSLLNEKIELTQYLFDGLSARLEELQQTPDAPVDWRIVQEIYLGLERSRAKEEIARLKEKCYKAVSLEQVQAGMANADSLCTQIAQWNSRCSTE